MNAVDIKMQLRQARQEMEQALAEQALQKPLLSPRYVPPIGAYAEDDPELYHAPTTEERDVAKNL